ncbi:integrase catalytic domain-containing protein [Trichonephila clavata]|uniref:Integrase catalytic domain-containing protein n=1 Tax=Trichonephila clavata TaxID=2740835 RepID=A0A8X6LUZ3_TRICU|nr:integrase catalytic domain-containing protein [Trichonephila clavata]
MIVEASKEPVTKRLLLKLMSKFYDPLGLFSPVTVIVKILFQDTWLSGIKWDELLPPAVAQQWHKWINELQCLKDKRIPRWIGFSETSDVTIHMFCDASERAYGACLYTRHMVNNFTELPSLESWWHGPKWLNHDSEAWPTKDFPSHSQPSVEVESRKTESRSFYVATTEPIIDISRYSSYTKLLRVTAWILRFVHNCKSHLRIIHELNCNEIEKAKDYWIQTVQRQFFSAEINALKEERPLQKKKSKISCFNPFFKDDYLRLGGRLQFSDIPFDTQNPLIRDGNHSFVHLLIQHTHKRLHHLGVRIVLSELRSTFWILRGGQAIKKALHKCLPYLTTDKFLLALQRFVGRRGLLNTIYTDNATTFHAANKELILLWQTLSSAKTQQYYAQNGITWRFIAPRAAWWGGWWKRLIGIVKQCLRKALGRALLDEESLSTVLIGIEAALNRRPLVYKEESDDNSAALTSAHFLTGRKLTAIPSRLENTRLNKIYKQHSTVLGKNGRKNIFFNYDPSIKFETRTVPLTSELEILCFCKKMSDHGTCGRKLE